MVLVRRRARFFKAKMERLFTEKWRVQVRAKTPILVGERESRDAPGLRGFIRIKPSAVSG